MPNPRRPAPVAKMTGADIKNPARHQARNDPTSPFLGEPSKFLPLHAKRAWRMFLAELPWLLETDRPMVEIASVLRGDLIAAKGGMSINQMQVFSAILSKLGASPVDRTRPQPLAQQEDEDEFFGRG